MSSPTGPVDPLAQEATLTVARALESLGIDYLIGGSMAAIAHGVIRMTNDVDLVADIGFHHVERLAAMLEPAYYLERDSIRDAIRRSSCFNLIHLASMFKVDVYLRRARRFDDVQFARRVQASLSGRPEHAAQFASAEDTILAKLEWFRLGGLVSERQWSDVLGLLKVQAGRLDLAHLRRESALMGLDDLLERALLSAGENLQSK